MSKKIWAQRVGSGLMTLLALTVVHASCAGTAIAGPPGDNPGKPFEQLEAKLDRIESALDRIGSRILPDGTRVATSSDDSRSILRLVAPVLVCTHPLGCTCFLDGIQTACSFVFACLDAGACTCVSGCDNVP